jgi:hypothetical protein
MKADTRRRPGRPLPVHLVFVHEKVSTEFGSGGEDMREGECEAMRGAVAYFADGAE